MSSAAILSQIKFYESIRGKVSGLHGYFDNCVSVSSLALKYNAYELVINGKPLTEGDITMKDIDSELKNNKQILDAIVSECNIIIDDLWVAYYAALEEEKKIDKKV